MPALFVASTISTLNSFHGGPYKPDTRTTRSYGILREVDPHGSVDIAMLAAADYVCRIVAEGRTCLPVATFKLGHHPHLQGETAPSRPSRFPEPQQFPFGSSPLRSNLSAREFPYTSPLPDALDRPAGIAPVGSRAYARGMVVCLLLPLIRICTAIRSSMSKISMVRAVSRTSISARTSERTSAMTSKALPGQRCANDRLYIGLRPRF